MRKTIEILMLLLCLSFNGVPGAYQTDLVVTDVCRGTVTLSNGERIWQIEGHEAWRIGDHARAIVLTRGTEDPTDDKIAHIEYVWGRRIE